MVTCLLLHVQRHSSKTVDRETSVVVVVLQNSADVCDCSLILVVWSHKMKTTWLSVKTVATSVVNSDIHRKLITRSDVVNKRGNCYQLAMAKNNLSSIFACE